MEIIAKYWLNFLLTLLSGGLIWLCKKFWNMYKAEKEKATSDVHEKMTNDLTDLIQESNEHSERQFKKINN